MRKSMSNSSSNAPSPPDSAPRSSNSPTSSDPQGSTSYHQSLDSYGASIHPGLVDQIRAFDGQLDAQINSARDQYAPIASGSHSNPGSDPGEYQVQQQYAPGPYHTYDSPPENGWPVPTSGPSSAHPSSNHQQMIPQIHHTMATPRHQSMALPPDIQQAHSLPMFGGVDSGPIGPTPHEGPQYSGYSVPVPHVVFLL